MHQLSRTSPFLPITLLLAALVSVTGFSCNRIADMVRSFSPSTVTLYGNVTDSRFGAPVDGVRIYTGTAVDTVQSDRNGNFTFENIPTGRTTISFVHRTYHEHSRSVDITLEPDTIRMELVRLAGHPVIDAFYIVKQAYYFADDSMTARFEASDSSGGIASVLFSGGAGVTGEFRADTGTAFMSDSIRFTYGGAGEYLCTLSVASIAGDTVLAVTSVPTTALTRPAFYLVRFPAGGFAVDRWECVDVLVSDPDSLFGYCSVTWGDGTAPVKKYDPFTTFCKKFPAGSGAFKNYSITIHDTAGVPLNDTAGRIGIRETAPPLLDDALLFAPKYCTITDTILRIGIAILEIEDGWVAEIDWIINEGNSDAISIRDTFNEFTGRVDIDTIGNVMSQTFPTQKLRGSNVVKIIVWDRFNNQSTASQQFYIAGKPD